MTTELASTLLVVSRVYRDHDRALPLHLLELLQHACQSDDMPPRVRNEAAHLLKAT